MLVAECNILGRGCERGANTCKVLFLKCLKIGISTYVYEPALIPTILILLIYFELNGTLIPILKNSHQIFINVAMFEKQILKITFTFNDINVVFTVPSCFGLLI